MPHGLLQELPIYLSIQLACCAVITTAACLPMHRTIYSNFCCTTKKILCFCISLLLFRLVSFKWFLYSLKMLMSMMKGGTRGEKYIILVMALPLLLIFYSEQTTRIVFVWIKNQAEKPFKSATHSPLDIFLEIVWFRQQIMMVYVCISTLLL